MIFAITTRYETRGGSEEGGWSYYRGTVLAVIDLSNDFGTYESLYPKAESIMAILAETQGMDPQDISITVLSRGTDDDEDWTPLAASVSVGDDIPLACPYYC